MKCRPRFLAWPGWPLFCEAIVLGTAQAIWWVFVYVGADWVTGLRSDRMRVHLAAELKVPLVPEFLLVYLSLDPLFLIAPFVLRTRAGPNTVFRGTTYRSNRAPFVKGLDARNCCHTVAAISAVGSAVWPDPFFDWCGV